MMDIAQLIAKRGITRLCHFTPSRNLQHIAAGKVGVLSTANLSKAERGTFNPTDLARLDGRTTHICCSIEYPNAWYFDKARGNEKLFPDWVVLLIKPDYLLVETTLFCPRNAAAHGGRNILQGQDGFEAMYADRIKGAYDKTFSRATTHLSPCPTDQQAEVLIFDRINMADIIGVAVQNEDQAKTEKVRLKINNIDPESFKFVIAPDLFNKYALSNLITSGKRAAETWL